jgi:hypothetical protein
VSKRRCGSGRMGTSENNGILFHVVEEDRGRAVPQPVGCDLHRPEFPARRTEPQIESPVGERPPGVASKVRENRQRHLSAPALNYPDLSRPPCRASRVS